MSDRADLSKADFLPRQLRDWALQAEHHAFLAAVFEAFDRFGDWPQRPALQRELAAKGRSLHLHGIELTMPRELGFSDPPEQRIVLLTFGIYCSGAGQWLLQQFVAVLLLAADRYRDPSEPAILRRGDLTEHLGLDGLEATKLSRILLREAPFLGGGRGDPFDWEREIHESIVSFSGVHTVEDYLRVRAGHLAAAAPNRLFVSAVEARHATSSSVLLPAAPSPASSRTHREQADLAEQPASDTGRRGRAWVALGFGGTLLVALGGLWSFLADAPWPVVVAVALVAALAGAARAWWPGAP